MYFSTPGLIVSSRCSAGSDIYLGNQLDTEENDILTDQNPPYLVLSHFMLPRHVIPL
jgi:hypothetical protein